MNRKFLIPFIIGILGYGLIHGRETEPRVFTLEEACRTALEHNTRVRNARLDVRIARKEIWETTALGLPQINGSISYQNMLEIPTTLVPARIFNPSAGEDEYLELKFGTQHNASYEVSASQLIFQGSYFVALQASRVFLQLSRDQLEKTRIDLKEEVSRTYYLVLLSRGLRDRLLENLEVMEKIHYETSQFHQAGFLEKTDADQVMITVLKLRYQLDSIKRQVTNTRRLLKFQMGIDLDVPVRLTGDLEDFVGHMDFAALMEHQPDMRENINFRILETRERSRELLLKKEKSEYLPGVSAFYSYTGNAMRNQFNFFSPAEKWFPSSVVGINIGMPVFTSGMQKAQVRQAELSLQKARNQKKEVMDSIELGLARARADYATGYGQYMSSRESLELARRIFEKTRIKYQKGLASSLELSQIHNQYLTAQTGYLNGMYTLLTARLILLKELNRL